MPDQQRAARAAEAYRRGLMSPEVRARYEAAVQRGIVNDAYAQGRIHARGAGVVGATANAINESVPGLDEVGAGLSTAVSAGINLLHGRPANVGGEWQGWRDFQQGQLDELHQNHPHVADLATGVGYAGQAAAALLSGGTTAEASLAADSASAARPAASVGRRLVRTAGRAARTGARNATQGATIAAGNALAGRGSLQDRVQAADRAIPPGAVLGAAVPVGAAVARVARGAAAKVATGIGRAAARTANRMSGGQLLDAGSEASRLLVAAMRRDGLTSAQLRQALTEWRAAGGPSPAFMDIVNQGGRGQNTMALVRGAAMTGSGRNVAAQHGAQVAADLQDTAIDRTRALTPGETRTAEQYQTDLRTQQRAADDTNYAAFQNEPVPMGDDIRGALAGDSGRAILGEARRVADVRRDLQALQEIDALSRGEGDHLSAGTLDLIRRVARDQAEVASRAGEQTLASGYQGRKNELETALDDIPGAANARAVHRGYSQAQEAVDLGTGARNAAPDVYAADLARAEAAVPPGGPSARQAAGVGMRQDLITAIGAPTEAATGTLNRIGTGTNVGRNLDTTYGPEVAQPYRQAIRQTIEQVQNARFVNPNTNSQSAGRLHDAALVDLPDIPPLSPLGIVKGLLDRVARGATLTDQERELIARLATTRVTGEEPPQQILYALDAANSNVPPPVSIAHPIANLLAIKAGNDARR